MPLTANIDRMDKLAKADAALSEMSKNADWLGQRMDAHNERSVVDSIHPYLSRVSHLPPVEAAVLAYKLEMRASGQRSATLKPLEENINREVEKALKENLRRDAASKSKEQVAWEEADRKLRAIEPEYTKATADYRARKIDDKEYLAIRKKRDALLNEWDKADIALRRSVGN